MTGFRKHYGSKAFWSAADAGVAPTSALLLTAGMLRTLSEDQFGVFVVIQSFSLLSLAINPAIVVTTMRFVAAARTEGTSGAPVQAIVTASFAAVGVVGLLLTALTFGFHGPLAQILFSGGGDTSAASVTLVWAVAALAILQIDATVGAVLKGMERFAAQGLYELGSRIAIVVLMLIVVAKTGRLDAALVAQFMAGVVSLMGRLMLLRVFMPGRRLLSRFTMAQLSPLMGFGGWMWLNAAATTAFGTVDRIVVANLLGSAVAGQYHVFVQVLQLIHFVPVSVLSFSFPILSRLYAQRQSGREELIRLFKQVFLAAGVGGSLLAIGLLAFGQPILHALTGQQQAGLPAAYIALAVTFALLAWNIGPYFLLLATGNSRSVSFVTTAAIAASLLLLELLVRQFGLLGAAYARGVYGLATLLLIALALRRLGR